MFPLNHSWFFSRFMNFCHELHFTIWIEDGRDGSIKFLNDTNAFEVRTWRLWKFSGLDIRWLRSTRSFFLQWKGKKLLLFYIHFFLKTPSLVDRCIKYLLKNSKMTMKIWYSNSLPNNHSFQTWFSFNLCAGQKTMVSNWVQEFQDLKIFSWKEKHLLKPYKKYQVDYLKHFEKWFHFFVGVDEGCW